MATDQRPKPGSLGANLRQSPQQFQLLQALLILEREQPDTPSLATTNDPQQDVVRLRGPLLPEFSGSQISSLRYVKPLDSPLSLLQSPQPERLTLHTPVFGLGGPDGPLPYAYQEWLHQRARLKDHATVAFLDLFQHRLLSLFYRVHLKQRVALPFRAPEQSPVYQQLMALCGLQPRLTDTPEVLPEKALIARAGLLANGRRSLAGFQNLLKHYFGMPFRLHGYQGGWRKLEQRSQTVLGRNGRNLVLGRNALCGSRVWDQHAGIGISIGPLETDVAQTLMPQQPAHKELAALVGYYFGADLECILTLQFIQADPLILDRNQPTRLGLDTWVGRDPHSGNFRVNLRLQTSE